MLQAYSITSTNYTQNSQVQFTTTDISDPRITVANSTFTIKCPGKYLVQFNGVGSSNTANSEFSVQLYKNNVAIPNAVAAVTSTQANNVGDLSFQTIVNVPRSCCIVDNSAALNIIVTSSEPGAIELANIIITKLR